MMQLLELSDKDFKAGIIKMLHYVRGNTFETNGKLECLSKEIEDKEEQIEILELKSKIAKINKYTKWGQYQNGDDRRKSQ